MPVYTLTVTGDRIRTHPSGEQLIEVDVTANGESYMLTFRRVEFDAFTLAEKRFAVRAQFIARWKHDHPAPPMPYGLSGESFPVTV